MGYVTLRALEATADGRYNSAMLLSGTEAPVLLKSFLTPLQPEMTQIERNQKPGCSSDSIERVLLNAKHKTAAAKSSSRSGLVRPNTETTKRVNQRECYGGL